MIPITKIFNHSFRGSLDEDFVVEHFIGNIKTNRIDDGVYHIEGNCPYVTANAISDIISSYGYYPGFEVIRGKNICTYTYDFDLNKQLQLKFNKKDLSPKFNQLCLYNPLINKLVYFTEKDNMTTTFNYGKIKREFKNEGENWVNIIGAYNFMGPLYSVMDASQVSKYILTQFLD